MAKTIGFDITQLKRNIEEPDIQRHIDNSMKLARALGFSGTPSFIIGERTAPGLILFEEFELLVKKARGGKN